MGSHIGIEHLCQRHDLPVTMRSKFDSVAIKEKSDGKINSEASSSWSAPGFRPESTATRDE
jgi:hypothetical protein